MKKFLAAILAAMFVLANCAISFAAPYESYNYSYAKEPVPEPPSYLPAKIITGKDLGVGDLKEPEDIVVSKQGDIYIVDTGNNRLIMLDKDWNVTRVVDRFERTNKNGTIQQDTLSAPQGMFVTEDGTMYIADTGHKRLVVLDKDAKFIREIGAPKSSVIRKDFDYKPRKVVVDKANRIYVVGPGMNDGIIEFDSDGNFVQFTGSEKVEPNMYYYFWYRTFATEAQRKQTMKYIAKEYYTLDIDEQGFLYAASSDSINRLNNQGEDITKKKNEQKPSGDLKYRPLGIQNGGPSKFIDVCVDEFNIVTGLDQVRGRIFTYDYESNLLSVFGKAPGDQEGTFKAPVAIENMGDSLLILDRDLKRITQFDLTEYGRMVRQAVILHYNGDYLKSASVWENVLKLNANSEQAYVGIGKALLRQNKNEEAIKYFKLGNDRAYYSKAYKKYRREVIRNIFGPIATSIIVLLIAWRIARKLWDRRAPVRKGGEKTYVVR